MDLVLILRAIWRRKLIIAACCAAFALVVPLGASLVTRQKYAASTDVTVFPSPTLDGSVDSAYQQQPDRFVATQIAVVSAREAAARVAQELHLDTQSVVEMIAVTQVNKSDVVRITATSSRADLSAKVATQLARDYVDTVTAANARNYKSAIESVDQQLATLAKQANSIQAHLTAIRADPSAPGQLQNELNSLISQQTTLNTQRGQLLVASQTASNNTRIVSDAAPSSRPIGPTKTQLALYGFLFGLGISALVVCLMATPGRTLDSMALPPTIDGAAVLGEFRTSSLATRLLARAGLSSRSSEAANVRVVASLRSAIVETSELVAIPLGRGRKIQHAVRALNTRVGMYAVDATTRMRGTSWSAAPTSRRTTRRCPGGPWPAVTGP